MTVRSQCSAQNKETALPSKSWPLPNDLAELFKYKHQYQQKVEAKMNVVNIEIGSYRQLLNPQKREKRRSSPSKQISGQPKHHSHNQQQELEWIVRKGRGS